MGYDVALFGELNVPRSTWLASALKPVDGAGDFAAAGDSFATVADLLRRLGNLVSVTTDDNHVTVEGMMPKDAYLDLAR